ncbi:SRPBCC domain-containing protein [Conyzicola sp.]|uniref:SRPBCC domain-containing protein n=1 Tax=Conyzicola sp. TaxID=1969404 RepID=UPI0039895FCC
MADNENGAVVDEQHFSVSRTVYVRTPRDRVWEALTTEDGIASWFGDTARLDEARVGTTGSLGWEDFGDYAFVVTAVVDGFLFEFRWAKDPGVDVSADNATSVRFVLADAPDGAILTVVESGFESLAGDDASRRELLHGNREGWNLELDELVRALGS